MADETKKTSRYEEEIPEFDRTKLKNADLNISQYGDDSSAKYYEDPTLWWWENAKYEGEWVKNTLTGYNPDVTLDTLGTYKYWQAAQMANSEQANYITNRNDQIASALYNAWLTSRDDVANYLSGQEWWNYSTEDERQNTINSIWKRLGSIASENDKSNTQDNEKDKQAEAVARMESDLSNNWWVIYGKVTWEKGNPVNWIETAVDENAVLNKKNEERIFDLKALMSMDSAAIAASEISWTIPYGETTMRDLAQYYPEKYAEIQAQKKKILAQMNVNAITNGEWINTVADTVDTNTQNTSYAVNNSSLSVSATQLLQAIDSHLESNDAAKSANELMWSIENDMSKLKNRLKNLKQEANQIFKWDVPDYIVKAYMNNKSQEIQNQLSILEDRYNAAYSRWRDEVSDAQWEEEMKLKRDSLALEEWKAKNTTSTTTTSSSQDWRMRTERNNNPTAMTTDYAKMMWLELWVDYEIWDSFIWWDLRTYYTAKFLWDPVETAIKAFDRWAANNVFANEWWVLWHWHLWISNQKWLSLTDWEKREVINKILQKEWGKMDNMSYYLNAQDSDEKVTYNKAWEDMLRQIATWQVKLNSATAKSYAEMMWTDVRWLWKMVEAYQNDQLENWKAAWRDLLNIMAELQILFEDKWLDDWQFDTNAWQSLWWGSIWRKHDQLKEQLKLNKVTEARDKWATFWQMTEYEWKVLENAATSLNILKQDDKEYTEEFTKIMRATWIATFWKAPTSEEWQKYVNEQRAYQNFNVSWKGSSSSNDNKLDQIWTWTVSWWIDFWSVVQNWR